MRIALGIEYDGSAYCGWQRQDGQKTVQGVVEQAVSRVADHPVSLSCAGRTDTGVHGIEQVVHFDSDAARSDRSWVLGSNVNLPRDVCVLWAAFPGEDFHARFSARARSYRYVILNRWVRSGLHGTRVTWVRRPLDEGRMQEAARALGGEHDFSSYRATACQAKSPVRTIESIELRRHGEYLVMDITANGFLHHMVRNIAGVLIAIGCGDRDPGWAGELLQTRSRVAGGVTAPAAGLYFRAVRYPQHFALPQRAQDAEAGAFSGL